MALIPVDYDPDFGDGGFGDPNQPSPMRSPPLPRDPDPTGFWGDPEAVGMANLSRAIAPAVSATGRVLRGAGEAIGGDVADIARGIYGSLSIPGYLEQENRLLGRNTETGLPEMTPQELASFGLMHVAGAAPSGSVGAGIGRGPGRGGRVPLPGELPGDPLAELGPPAGIGHNQPPEPIGAPALVSTIPPGEAAAGPAAAAPGTPPRSGLIRNSDLDTVLPVENRRIGPYKEGVGTVPVVGGADWTDLDMSQSIGGMKSSAADLQKAWDDAVETVRSWSPEQAEKLDKYLADNPQVGPNTPKFWNDALSQPQKMRYWYENGARKFQSEGLDQHPEDMRDALNVTAATSPSAEPLQNLQRTVGVLAEHQQGQPISTDLIQPGTVRMALTTGMEAPKTANYTGTFLHIAGADDKPPISVNDRQHGEVLGMDPDELAKRPDLYALASQFTQNFRDAENAARPGVAAGTENPFESWQIQAPAWTHYRGTKDPTKIGVSDDYADVMDNHIKPQLEAAGVDTSKGLFSPEVLGHPDVPNLMSGTRAQYLATPTATIETATKMTPEGREATDLLSRLPPAGPDAPPWANTARYKMERLQRDAMDAVTTGGGKSVVSQLVAPVIGRKGAAVSRVDNNGWGTYQGDISPNLRIPMWAQAGSDRISLTPEQIHPVLSALGEGFGQEAAPASHFETMPLTADAGGRLRTYSVFVPETGPGAVPTTTAQVQQFQRLIGHGGEVSATRRPNGILVDVHPAFTDQGVLPPSGDQVQAAAIGAFDQPGRNIQVYPRAYQSYYVEHPSQNAIENYDTHINDFWEGQRNAGQDDVGRPGGVRAQRWSAGERAGAFEDARQKVRDIAEQQRIATQAWIDQFKPRVERYEQTPPAARGRQLRPLAGLAGAGLLGAGYGALTNPAQAAQPPPNLIPVDHDPFAGEPPAFFMPGR
ncbi:MAG TPA: hypothetical protein VGF39_03805 [Stellaceae bacterium]|jgi:hypothetical protein